MSKPTKGPWQFACDSYGKVQHSNMACLFAVERGPGGGERLVRVASRIKNWFDARLAAQAPQLLETLTDLEHLASVLNARQHAGLNITPTMWAELFDRCADAKLVCGAANGDREAELALRNKQDAAEAAPRAGD